MNIFNQSESMFFLKQIPGGNLPRLAGMKTDLPHLIVGWNISWRAEISSRQNKVKKSRPNIPYPLTHVCISGGKKR